MRPHESPSLFKRIILSRWSAVILILAGLFGAVLGIGGWCDLTPKIAKYSPKGCDERLEKLYGLDERVVTSVSFTNKDDIAFTYNGATKPGGSLVTSRAMALELKAEIDRYFEEAERRRLRELDRARDGSASRTRLSSGDEFANWSIERESDQIELVVRAARMHEDFRRERTITVVVGIASLLALAGGCLAAVLGVRARSRTACVAETSKTEYPPDDSLAGEPDSAVPAVATVTGASLGRWRPWLGILMTVLGLPYFVGFGGTAIYGHYRLHESSPSQCVERLLAHGDELIVKDISFTGKEDLTLEYTGILTRWRDRLLSPEDIEALHSAQREFDYAVGKSDYRNRLDSDIVRDLDVWVETQRVAGDQRDARTIMSERLESEVEQLYDVSFAAYIQEDYRTFVPQCWGICLAALVVSTIGVTIFITGRRGVPLTRGTAEMQPTAPRKMVVGVSNVWPNIRIVVGTLVALTGVFFGVALAIMTLTGEAEVRENEGIQVVLFCFALLVVIGLGVTLVYFGRRGRRSRKALAAILSAEDASSVNPASVAERFNVSGDVLQNAIAQQERVAEVAAMRRRGELAWHWPAACGVGIWALANGIWCKVFGEVYRKWSTWVIEVLWVGMIILAGFDEEPEAISLAFLFGFLVVIVQRFFQFGYHGTAWLYTFKGISPKTRQGAGAGDTEDMSRGSPIGQAAIPSDAELSQSGKWHVAIPLPEDERLDDAQRNRAREAAVLRATGKRLAWNWSACLMMGIWALQMGIWPAFIRMLWSTRWTYVITGLGIVLCLFDFWPAFLLVFAYVAYVCGRYGSELDYIVTGRVRPQGEGDMPPQPWFVGVYLVLWGIALAWHSFADEFYSLKSWSFWFTLIVGAAIAVVGIGLMRNTRTAALTAIGCMVVTGLLLLTNLALTEPVAELYPLGFTAPLVGIVRGMPYALQMLIPTWVGTLASPAVVAIVLGFHLRNRRTS